MPDQVLVFDGPPNTVLELRTTNEQDVHVTAKPAATVGSQPLTTVFFVDRGADPGGNGSIGAPFQTVQQGVAAVAALGEPGTVMVAPGQYTGDPDVVVPAFCEVTIEGMGALVSLPRIDWEEDVGPLTLINCSARLIGTELALVQSRNSGLDVTGGPAGASIFMNGGQLEGSATGPNAVIDELEASGTTIRGGITANSFLFEACDFVIPRTIAGPIDWDRPSEVSAARNGAKITEAPHSTDGIAERLYGTGDTGVLNLAGIVTPGGTEEWSQINVTTGIFTGNGGRAFIFCRDLLDLSVASATALTDELSQQNGGNAAGSVGGAGTAGANGNTDQGPGTAAGVAGSAGVAGNGSTPAAGANIRNICGGRGGNSGAGGNSGGNTGGAGGAQAGQQQQPISHLTRFAGVGPGSSLGTPETWFGGTGGRGGSSGAGDGTNLGGGGGGSGLGGGFCAIFARCIKVSALTPANVLHLRAAGNGGNGGNGAAGNAAGGGGGGGGGGGHLTIFYEWLIGAKPEGVALLRCDGGAGGKGGNGVGTGAGGTGGGGGTGGVIQQFNTLRNERSRTVGTAGVVGNGPAGTVGGTGGAGGSANTTFNV